MKPALEADRTVEAMKPNSVHGVQRPVADRTDSGGGARQNSGFSPAPGIQPGSGAAGPTLWSTFWQEFCLENVPHERCHIPGDGRLAVDRHWALFADALPPGAEVIDLGCGAGIAGRILLSRRKDVRVTGIDFADVPTPAVQNLTIHPWVSMEAIPFGDGSFDAAISLFGIEYGNIGKTAGELGRILKPGARFSFLVHHVESEIVCEGATRRTALRELLSGPMRAAFLAGSIPRLDQQIRRLRNRFPDEPSVRLFTSWLSRDINHPRPVRQTAWQNLLNGLDPEIALLTLMQRSAKSAAAMGAWIAPLLPVMRIVSVSVIRRKSGEPIAWQVSGIR